MIFAWPRSGYRALAYCTAAAAAVACRWLPHAPPGEGMSGAACALALRVQVPDAARGLPVVVFAPGMGNAAADYAWLSALRGAVVVRLECTPLAADSFHEDLNPVVARVRTQLGWRAGDAVVYVGHSLGARPACLSALTSRATRAYVVLFAPAWVPRPSWPPSIRVPVVQVFGTEDCVTSSVTASIRSPYTVNVAVRGANHRFWSDSSAAATAAALGATGSETCVSLTQAAQASYALRILQIVVDATGRRESPEESAARVLRSIEASGVPAVAGAVRVPFSACCCRINRWHPAWCASNVTATSR